MFVVPLCYGSDTGAEFGAIPIIRAVDTCCDIIGRNVFRADIVLESPSMQNRRRKLNISRSAKKLDFAISAGDTTWWTRVVPTGFSNVSATRCCAPIRGVVIHKIQTVFDRH
jgi:hypothetical protein